MILGLTLKEGKMTQLHQVAVHGMYKYVKIYSVVSINCHLGFFLLFYN